jgi:hypothetical protein
MHAHVTGYISSEETDNILLYLHVLLSPDACHREGEMGGEGAMGRKEGGIGRRKR